jgi:hypothetical protein
VNNAPNVIVRPPVLESTRVVVADDHDLVKITVGNSTLVMRYEDALRFSQMVRVHAKKAKRFVGDASRHWSAVAVLDNLPG